jgi:hypothetical protein
MSIPKNNSTEYYMNIFESRRVIQIENTTRNLFIPYINIPLSRIPLTPVLFVGITLPFLPPSAFLKTE